MIYNIDTLLIGFRSRCMSCKFIDKIWFEPHNRKENPNNRGSLILTYGDVERNYDYNNDYLSIGKRHFSCKITTYPRRSWLKGTLHSKMNYHKKLLQKINLVNQIVHLLSRLLSHFKKMLIPSIRYQKGQLIKTVLNKE